MKPLLVEAWMRSAGHVGNRRRAQAGFRTGIRAGIYLGGGLLLAGCWQPAQETISYDTVYLDNEWIEDTEVLVETFTTTLACPDEEYAKFYAVYRTDIDDDPPVAIVFHSGAFDYVVNPSAQDPLGGTHYRQGENGEPDNRLERSWASTRVFSILGMWEELVDPDETHTGSLPSVLAESGTLALYPGNCWGDLWHNEQGNQSNDETTDRFYRNGRALAFWMLRILVDEDFAQDRELTLPVTFNHSPQISLLGLGDGGRAATELLLRLADEDLYDTEDKQALRDSIPSIHGVLLDATADDLTEYAEGDYSTPYDEAGLERIFYDASQEISTYSLQAYLEDEDNEWPERLMVLWSEADPRMASSSIQPLVEYLESEEVQENHADDVVVTDMGTTDHVFSNNDIMVSHDVVDFLVTE